MDFWEIYSSLCEKAGEKPQPLGKKLGAASSTVTQWKNGSIPSGEKLIAIADYFDCSIDYLLGRAAKKLAPRINGERAGDRKGIQRSDRHPARRDHRQSKGHGRAERRGVSKERKRIMIVR